MSACMRARMPCVHGRVRARRSAAHVRQTLRLCAPVTSADMSLYTMLFSECSLTRLPISAAPTHGAAPAGNDMRKDYEEAPAPASFKPSNVKYDERYRRGFPPKDLLSESIITFGVFPNSAHESLIVSKFVANCHVRLLMSRPEHIAPPEEVRSARDLRNSAEICGMGFSPHKCGDCPPTVPTPGRRTQ